MDVLLHSPLFSNLAFPAIATVAAIFTRLSALFFFLPGVGERAVSIPIRLGAALAITLILTPAVISHSMQPNSISQAGAMIIAEALIGALLGFSVRIAIYILQMAGSMASQSFSLAQLFGSGIDIQPEPPVASLLMIAGIALFVSSGLHFEMINVLIVSFKIMPLGLFPGVSETGEWAANRVAFAFAAALSLALPFVTLGFIYNLAIGAANRAMPQLMVAFVGVPAVTLAGLVLLALSAPTLLNVWTSLVDELIGALMERLR